MTETEALYLWAGFATGVAVIEFFWLLAQYA
jgi:hypothetical protein